LLRVASQGLKRQHGDGGMRVGARELLQGDRGGDFAFRRP
jgi:hypothetical protein